MRNRPGTSVRIYQLVIILTGFVIYTVYTAMTPMFGSLNWVAGLVVFTAALQAFFSITLFSNRYSIAHSTALGFAILFDPIVAGWAAVGGMLLGHLLIVWRERRQASRSPHVSWRDSLFSAGSLLLALTLAFRLTVWVGNGSLAATGLSPDLLLAVVLFMLTHSILLLAEILTRSAHRQADFQRDVVWFTALELLPVAALGVAGPGFLPTGSAGAWLYAGVLSLLAVLLYYYQRAQRAQSRLEQELETLNLVSQAIQSTLEMDQLLPELQHLISHQFGVDNFYVAIYNEDEGLIHYPIAVKRGIRRTWASREKADRLTDRVIFEQAPLIIPSQVRQELVRIGLPPGEDPPAAWMGVPLLSSDQVIGCIAVFTYSPELTFSATDLDLFVTLSGQVGVAIANALLHEKLKQRASQLEAINQFSIDVSRSLDIKHVFSNVCQALTRVVDASRSAVFVLDLERGWISLVHSTGLSEEFTSQSRSFSFAEDARAQCMRSGHPDLVPDIHQANFDPEYRQLLIREGIGALGSFPLVSPDGQIGFLSVFYGDHHEFGSEELELVQSFTAQAALAVSNARLHERTDLALSRRVRQLSVLETISRELAAATYSDQLLDKILNYSMEFTNATWGMFSILDPETQKLQPKAQRGYQQALGDQALDTNIPGRAARQQSAINIPDISLEDGEHDFTLGKAGSHLSVPLLHQSCVLGVLSLESEDKHAFSDGDLVFVSQLANQAAIVLQNAQLFTDISSVRDRLSAVLDSVREGILLFDQSGRVILTNKAAGDIASLNPEEIPEASLPGPPGLSMRRLGFQDGTPVIEQLKEASRQKSVIEGAPGELVLERSIVPVRGATDEAVGWMLVLRDLTDELRVVRERELITETLIHDLRSPLSAVLGALEVMETVLPAKDADDHEISVQAVQVARRGAQRVIGLVENLMDIAKMQSGKMELTRTQADLHKLTATVINEFLHQSLEYGIILQNGIPSDWPRVFIDQGKIARVIANLIDNALKYAPSGTQVLVSGDIGPKESVCIRVSDRGPGIPAEYREKIFERFGQIPGLRGRRRGTGLGLTFCKLAVETHGGQIWVETNPGGGSDFVFTLPMSPAGKV